MENRKIKPNNCEYSIFTAQKVKLSVNYFYDKYEENLQFPADLFTFIINKSLWKTSFLCSVFD